MELLTGYLKVSFLHDMLLGCIYLICIQVTLYNQEDTRYQFRILRQPINIPAKQLELYGVISENGEVPESVLCSLTISRHLPHPFAARNTPRCYVRPRKPSPKAASSPLNSIGVRIFGRHPHAEKRFDSWIYASDFMLKKILAVANRVKDRAEFDRVCTTGLNSNLAGEWFGGEQESLSDEGPLFQVRPPFERSADNSDGISAKGYDRA
jgi:hypothetical protein